MFEFSLVNEFDVASHEYCKLFAASDASVSQDPLRQEPPHGRRAPALGVEPRASSIATARGAPHRAIALGIKARIARPASAGRLKARA